MRATWMSLALAAAIVLPRLAAGQDPNRPGPPDRDGPPRHFDGQRDRPQMPPPGFGDPRGPMPDLKDVFQRMDKDKDGKLSLEEFVEGMKHLHAAMMGGPMGPHGPMPGGPMPPQGPGAMGRGPMPPMHDGDRGPGGPPPQDRGPGGRHERGPDGPPPQDRGPGGPPPQAGGPHDGKPLEARLKDLEAKLKALEAKLDAK